ncbi:MAG: O-antigen ligase family protein [Chloroflexota bacterium]|jgi:hypothetical protein
MIEILAPKTRTVSIKGQARRASLTWALWFLFLLAITSLIGTLLLMGTPKPDPAILVGFLFLVAAAVIIYKPRYGIYLTLFFALVGDSTLNPAYPFFKNFSSQESFFYLHDALIFSPLELFLLLTLISWLGRGIMRRKLDFYAGPLFWPVMVFTAFIILGLAYGLARGGDINIALWEVRPILYLPIMLILVSNLLTKREHASHLLWVIMVALFVEGLNGLWHYFFVLERNLELVESITEHSAAIHMNTFFVFVLAVWLYKASPTKRILLPLMIPPILITYLATQRRAGYITLLLALLLLAIVLYIENRRAFLFIVPPLALAGLLYLGAFWNQGGALAKPAQAVKSVIALDQASDKDQRSTYFREIENYNSLVTIRSAPLTGVGFGNQFINAVPLPDISFFQWWQYMTHNSIIYIWMKAGFGGFLALLVLVGLAIMTGMRVLLRMPQGGLRAAALLAILYVAMHFVYAYVDLSWDSQSMLYVGAMLGLINVLEHLVAKPVPVPAKRWPWQPDPDPAPGLQPLPGD